MRPIPFLATVLAALLLGGCFVDVSHTRRPEGALRDARAEAARVQGRPGPPHSINVLKYDPKDGKLVKVHAPVWIVRKLGGIALRDDDDPDVALARRCLKKENLEKAALGILAEVEEEDGGQVLVWLR